MILSKRTAFTIVFALIVATGIVTTGCTNKTAHHGWVNTSSLPGNTFADHSSKNTSSTIVYMGDNHSSSNSNFGPSFNFNDLKR